MWWAVPFALADEPVSEEVTIHGEAVERARAAVEARLVGLGYDQVVRRDGKSVFRSEQSWKGKVVLTDEGTLRVRRRGPTFKKIDPIAGTNVRPYPLCLIMPTACLKAGSWYVSERRWGQVEDDVADATTAPLVEMSEAMADRAVARTVEALPDRLEALWTLGVPLSGTGVVTTAAGRRAALLEFWDTRTETEWGFRVREVVEGFVRGRVQQSEEPFTAEERAAFDARRRSAHPFPFVAGE